MIPMATGTWLLVSWLSLLRGSRRGPSPLLQAVGCAHLTLPCTSGWWALLALVAVLPLGVRRRRYALLGVHVDRAHLRQVENGAEAQAALAVRLRAAHSRFAFRADAGLCVWTP